MTQITEFNRDNCAALHQEAAALLAPLEAKYGIKILRSGGSLGSAKLTLKFDFLALGEEVERREFNAHCAVFGCKPEDYGREATINGKSVKLVGFSLSRAKFPVRCRVTGAGGADKMMLYAEDVLYRFFHTGRAPSIPAARVSHELPLRPGGA